VFFELIKTKSIFKNQLWRHFSDTIVITSLKKRQQLTSQDVSILPSPPIKTFCYGSVLA